MKQHYAVLDGLRGVAAFVVLAFHIVQQSSTTALAYASYAVDFFYVLSGFVVALAYESKLERGMSFRQFMTVRLVRLYPLIFVGLALGVTLAVLSWVVTGAPALSGIAAAAFLGLLLLPSYVFPQWATAFPFNMAAWSLTFEVAVNIVYALIARYLTTPRLCVITAISAVALVALGVLKGTFLYGNDQAGFAYGFIRVMFPFFAGVLLFRFKPTVRPSTLTSVVLLVLLAIVLLLPIARNVGIALGLVLVVMPMIVWVGAAVEPSPGMSRFCLIIGQLSYPIYILHGPLLRAGAEVKTRLGLAGLEVIAINVALFFAVTLFAYLALKLFDEPARAWLGRYLRRSTLTANV